MEFATYDFVRYTSNTITFQTAEIDLTPNGDYTVTTARIGIRVPWGFPNGSQAFIQTIELYKDAVALEEIKTQVTTQNCILILLQVQVQLL